MNKWMILGGFYHPYFWFNTHMNQPSVRLERPPSGHRFILHIRWAQWPRFFGVKIPRFPLCFFSYSFETFGQEKNRKERQKLNWRQHLTRFKHFRKGRLLAEKSWRFCMVSFRMHSCCATMAFVQICLVGAKMKGFAVEELWCLEIEVVESYRF